MFYDIIVGAPFFLLEEITMLTRFSRCLRCHRTFWAFEIWLRIKLRCCPSDLAYQIHLRALSTGIGRIQ